jgi:hypothetical protein
MFTEEVKKFTPIMFQHPCDPLVHMHATNKNDNEPSESFQGPTQRASERTEKLLT